VRARAPSETLVQRPLGLCGREHVATGTVHAQLADVGGFQCVLRTGFSAGPAGAPGGTADLMLLGDHDNIVAARAKASVRPL
jgi:hypothetical protein